MGSTAVILAAGKGTRMRSDLPKVLHRLANRPLISYPLVAAARAGIARAVIVVGHGGEQVEQTVRAEVPGAPPELVFVTQPEQLGTGHAVLCALPEVPKTEEPVLILSGDVPLVRAATLARLAEAQSASDARLAIAVFRPVDPSGYGRIVRAADTAVYCIIEEKDADPSQLKLRESNAGTYAVSGSVLHSELPKLEASAAGEIYLTDLVAARARVGAVQTVDVGALEASGVNTPEQLEALQTAAQLASGKTVPLK